jgi:hypothetical protein
MWLRQTTKNSINQKFKCNGLDVPLSKIIPRSRATGYYFNYNLFCLEAEFQGIHHLEIKLKNIVLAEHV